LLHGRFGHLAFWIEVLKSRLGHRQSSQGVPADKVRTQPLRVHRAWERERLSTHWEAEWNPNGCPRSLWVVRNLLPCRCDRGGQMRWAPTLARLIPASKWTMPRLGAPGCDSVSTIAAHATLFGGAELTVQLEEITISRGKFQRSPRQN